MKGSLCGVDCAQCGFKDSCGGCKQTEGRPFGGECVVAQCCKAKGCENFGNCVSAECVIKKKLIDEFNSLEIKDMEKVTSLNSLAGFFVNVEYSMPSGQKVKLLDDKKIYLGNQLRKKDSDRCYGIAADENMLLVCEYGEGGSDAEIVVYKRR